MKRVSVLKRTIAKMIIALFVIALLTGLCYALYSMGGWFGLGMVAGGVGVFCAFCALGWAINTLENKE